MDDVSFKDIYGLSDKDKESLIKRLSEDVSFMDEESVYEIDDQFETMDDYETLEEEY
jgi:hypothetical protein